MTALDYIIVLGYFFVMLAIGFLNRKQASDDVQSYFLGAHKIPGG